MKRRLYYLFPDVPHAQTLSRELSDLATQLSVHAVVDKQTSFPEGNHIHTLAETERDSILEWYVWRMSPVIFSWR